MYVYDSPVDSNLKNGLLTLTRGSQFDLTEGSRGSFILTTLSGEKFKINTTLRDKLLKLCSVKGRPQTAPVVEPEPMVEPELKLEEPAVEAPVELDEPEPLAEPEPEPRVEPEPEPEPEAKVEEKVKTKKPRKKRK